MIDMHPPANRRCAIYSTGEWNVATGTYEIVARCTNEGTHWVRWGGCTCNSADRTYCEQDMVSWECDGHAFTEVTGA